MMRIAWIILVLTVIAVAMVHLRIKQNSVRAQTYRLKIYRYQLRRQLWYRQVHLGKMVSPVRMENVSRKMALKLQTPGVDVSNDDRIARRD